MIALLSSLKGEKTLILVEHDMDAVFSLADRSPCWSTAHYRHRDAAGGPLPTRGTSRVPGRGGRSVMLEVDGLATAYGRARCCSASPSAWARAKWRHCSADGRQDHTVRSVMGMVRPRGGRSSSKGRPCTACLVPRGAGGARSGAGRAAGLSQPHGARDLVATGPSARASRALDASARIRLFPALAGRRGTWQPALGGEQQMPRSGALMTIADAHPRRGTRAGALAASRLPAIEHLKASGFRS